MKRGEPIERTITRVGLTSSPHIETGDSKASIMSEESIVYTREELKKRKEGLYQKDTEAKGGPFEMCCSLTTVSLLQVYIVSIPIDCAQYAQNQVVIPEDTSRTQQRHTGHKLIVTCICILTH